MCPQRLWTGILNRCWTVRKGTNFTIYPQSHLLDHHRVRLRSALTGRSWVSCQRDNLQHLWAKSHSATEPIHTHGWEWPPQSRVPTSLSGLSISIYLRSANRLQKSLTPLIPPLSVGQRYWVHLYLHMFTLSKLSKGLGGKLGRHEQCKTLTG